MIICSMTCEIVGVICEQRQERHESNLSPAWAGAGTGTGAGLVEKKPSKVGSKVIELGWLHSIVGG